MSGHKITSSESVDNILLQSYHDPENSVFLKN